MNDYPEPTWTAENMNRKEGDTTFKQCGWCEYHGGGTCRYDCHLDTSCSLMKPYGLDRDVHWNTRCIIKKLGKIDLRDIIQSKRYKIQEARKEITWAKEQIKTLQNIPEYSIHKPPLPDNRIGDFNESEIVWIFHQDRWSRGTVVSGYRSHDGCVSYVLDDYPKNRKGWGCGCAVPCVLKNWEYRYFRKHLKEFQVWLDLSDREYNGKRLPLDKYMQAMKNGK